MSGVCSNDFTLISFFFKINDLILREFFLDVVLCYSDVFADGGLSS